MALEDRCPHRGAPLSAGTCDNGTIRCPYHGWRFGSDGRCLEIPALQRAEPHRRVPTYPVQERAGLVWVYSEPEAPPGSEPPVPPGPGPDWRVEATFDAGLPLVLENVLDVPHTSFVHAGSFRNPGRDPVRVRLVPIEHGAEAHFLDEPRPSGWLARWLAPGATRVEHVDRYLHPCVAEVQYAVGPMGIRLSSALRPDAETRTHMFTAVRLRAKGPWRTAVRALEPVARRILEQDRWILGRLQDNLHAFEDRRLSSSEADVLGPVILRAWKRAAEGLAPVAPSPREVTLWL